eukprot:gnl/Chilomastix_cuspidata/1901.p1 GENE.gnl/Chilomastix_cuspidata/1901~~gnl/Chilomastix_cuspidata/1901.p1  ORF type:complete len:482 (+),score=187.51 gnl/Chilomastix_cuspidata/1901:235-1680(+)
MPCPTNSPSGPPLFNNESPSIPPSPNPASSAEQFRRAQKYAALELPLAAHKAHHRAFRVEALKARGRSLAPASRADADFLMHSRLEAAQRRRLADLAARCRCRPARAAVLYPCTRRSPFGAADEAARRVESTWAHVDRLSAETNKARRLAERHQRLLSISALAAPPTDARARALLAATVREMNHPSARVGSFCAFPGAGALAYVQRALELPPGEALALPPETAPPAAPPGCLFAGFAAALSRAGCLMFLSPRGQALVLADLVHAGRTATLPVPFAATFVTAVDGTIFVGREGCDFLYTVPVAGAFRGGGAATLRRRAVPFICGSVAHLDLAPWTGKILYRGERGAYVELDLRAFASRELLGTQKVLVVASQAGVLPAGVRFFLNSGTPPHVNVSFSSREGFRSPQHTPARWPAHTLLPSAARPSDVRQSVFLDVSGALLSPPPGFALPADLSPPLLRLFRDVFLWFGPTAGVWHVARIPVR